MVYSYEKPVVPVASSIHPYSIAQKQHSSSKNHCDKNGFPKMEIIMKADNMIRDVEKSLRDSEKNIDAARKNGITRAMPECRVSCAPTDPGATATEEFHGPVRGVHACAAFCVSFLVHC